MIGYLIHHGTQLVLLLIIFTTFILVFSEAQYAAPKLLIIVVLSVLYFLFGILHHVQEKNLTAWVTLEYMVISSMLMLVMLAISN